VKLIHKIIYAFTMGACYTGFLLMLFLSLMIVFNNGIVCVGELNPYILYTEIIVVSFTFGVFISISRKLPKDWKNER